MKDKLVGEVFLDPNIVGQSIIEYARIFSDVLGFKRRRLKSYMTKRTLSYLTYEINLGKTTIAVLDILEALNITIHEEQPDFMLIITEIKNEQRRLHTTPLDSDKN